MRFLSLGLAALATLTATSAAFQHSPDHHLSSGSSGSGLLGRDVHIEHPSARSHGLSSSAADLTKRLASNLRGRKEPRSGSRRSWARENLRRSSPETPSNCTHKLAQRANAPSSSGSSSASPSKSSPSSSSAGGSKAGNSSSSSSKSGMVMAGYWPDWTAGSMPPESIDFSKFDYIDFAFVLPTADHDLSFSSDNSKGLLTRLVKAAHAGNSKVVLSIGGWGGSTYFSPSVATESARSAFISNIKKIYDQYKLDGIDLDWEYPNSAGAGGQQTSPSDATNFQTFLVALRAALPKGALITAAVPHLPWLGSDGQPISDVSRAADALDYVLIMNYDVWGASSEPGPNAPLANLCGNSMQPSASAAAGVKQWSAAGMPRSKILLGVPSYGYINTSSQKKLKQRDLRAEGLAARLPESRARTDVPSGAVGRYDARFAPSSAHVHRRASGITNGDGSSADGQVQFNDMVKQGVLSKGSNGLYVAGKGFTKYWDDCSDTPYLSNGNTVITYDDTSSLFDKGAFAKQSGIAGANIFSINGDTKDWALASAVIKGMNS